MTVIFVKLTIKAKIPYMTTIAAKATASGIKGMIKYGDTGVKSIQELHSEICDK